MNLDCVDLHLQVLAALVLAASLDLPRGEHAPLDRSQAGSVPQESLPAKVPLLPKTRGDSLRYAVGEKIAAPFGEPAQISCQVSGASPRVGKEATRLRLPDAGASDAPDSRLRPCAVVPDRRSASAPHWPAIRRPEIAPWRGTRALGAKSTGNPPPGTEQQIRRGPRTGPCATPYCPDDQEGP